MNPYRIIPTQKGQLKLEGVLAGLKGWEQSSFLRDT